MGKSNDETGAVMIDINTGKRVAIAHFTVNNLFGL